MKVFFFSNGKWNKILVVTVICLSDLKDMYLAVDPKVDRVDVWVSEWCHETPCIFSLESIGKQKSGSTTITGDGGNDERVMKLGMRGISGSSI